MVDDDLAGLACHACANVAGSQLAGVLIFGSQVRGNHDASSDVDLLCLSNEETFRKQSLQFSKRLFEVQVVSAVQLRAALDQTKWRENVLLLALKSGMILLDKQDQLREFQQEAESLWTIGSQSLLPADLDRIQEGAHRLKAAAMKLGTRLDSSALTIHDTHFLRAHLDTVHVSTVMLYTRVFQRWFFPSWIAKNIPESFYENLSEMNGKIYSEPDWRRRGQLISNIADAALTQVSYLRKQV